MNPTLKQFIAFLAIIFASLQTNALPIVYVQAGEGSFNHQAIALLESQTGQRFDIRFSSTPEQTMSEAVLADADVFVAVQNNLLPGQLVQATVDALKIFRVVTVHDLIRMPINQCLLRHQQAVSDEVPLTRIVSHPAALQQVSDWAKQIHLATLEEPKGTAFAAKLLSEGELPVDSGVVGAAHAARIYTNLTVVQCNLANRPDNFTTFMRAKVVKRLSPIDEATARESLVFD